VLLKLSDFTHTRFFGRIIRAEIACPRCQRVARLQTRGGGGWDPKISRWTCPGCGLVLVMGIIAWVPDQGLALAPHDHVPTLLESAALRHLKGWKVEGERTRSRQEVNVVIVDNPEEGSETGGKK